MPQLHHIEPGPDTFRILLTTDNHVGYMEHDPIRGDDSWKTFAEIMHIAQDKDVDFVLEGGDLFHVNQPSKKSYYHVIETLRECCWSDKPIEFKLVSDPSNAMATRHFSYPAEYDNNVNVGIPVYAISGNHDDSTGDELLSPLDLLSVGALLNHFGRVADNDHIKLYPLLFNKGSTNLALYGMQNIREERLKKTMASENLEFLQPDEEDGVKWFNIMTIHQNHVPRPGIRIVEEINLPDFLDFIFWGHEHDCVPSAIKNSSTGFSVLQAGSSIATSLSEGELAEKHVFILSVKGQDFSLEPIPLKTVRPFAMKSITLTDTGLSATSANKEQVMNFLVDQVESLIDDACSRWKKSNVHEFENEELTESDIPLPLIRLRVEYSGGYEVENPRYFSNRFVGKVANVNDVLTLYRKKSTTGQMIKEMVKENDAINEGTKSGESTSPSGETNIFNMIDSQLNDQDLILIRKNDFSTTLNELISKGDKNVLDHFVRDEETKSLKLLAKLDIEDDDNEYSIGSIKKGTSQVTGVKKSFRKLAKRIRAEATYKEEPVTVIPDVSETRTVRNVSKNKKSTRRKKPIATITIDDDNFDQDSHKAAKPVSRRRRNKASSTRSDLPPSLFGGL